MNGLFITATGTGVGKTWFACALARACVQKGKTVAAIKPMESGCNPDPQDGIRLAEACGNPSLATAEGLYRAQEPLAPYAVEKRGGPAVGSLRAMSKRVRELAKGSDFTIVEGVGGALVPLDREHTIADFAAMLDLPAILVARNDLGVLSYTLTAMEALRKRKISVRAIVLNHVQRSTRDDLSRLSNRDVLADYFPRIPVRRFPRVQHEMDLVDSAVALLETLKI